MKKFNPTYLLVATSLIAAGTLAMAPAYAADKASSLELSASQSKVWIEGTSTLHPFHSTAKTVEFNGSSVSGLQVVVPVKSLKSGEGGLDDNLYKALKASENPTIKFAASAGKLKVSPSGEANATAEGTLTIAGTSHPVTVRAEGKVNGKTVHLTGEKEISMAEFGVKPPVLFLGAVKCGDKITVHYDLVGEIK